MAPPLQGRQRSSAYGGPAQCLARSRHPTCGNFSPQGLRRPVFSPAKHTSPAHISGCGGMHAGKCPGSRKHSTIAAVPWHSAPFTLSPSPSQWGGGDPSERGPFCKWGGPADSPHSAITSFPRDLNPAVISSLANLWGACKQSPRDGVGRPGQDTEWRLVATPCLRPRAGIEASALLLTKPVSRDQCLEGLGQEQGGFCVLM